MNQVKPYLLWIVAGVLFLVLIVLMAVVSPTVELDGGTKNAYEIKSTLDADAKKLKALVKRARTGDPVGIYDPQSETDIRKLTNEYLLTNRWLEVINPHVTKYSAQLGQIREDLQARSKVLVEPVAPTSDRLQWYAPYQQKTGELVGKLRDAGCLVLPTDGTKKFQPAVPMGGPQGMPGAGAAPGAAEGDVLDPEKNAKIRALIGLFTSEGELPEADQHPLLTTRFRIAERIANAVINSTAETLPNPVIARGVPVRTPAAFAAWEWKQDSEPLESPIGDYARPWRCTVTLQGSESSLVAALANIESLDRPILVVLGSTLSRIDRTPAGARMLQEGKGVNNVAQARLEIQILVLDFSEMPELTPGAAATTGRQPGAGSMMPVSGGMPPGMPGGMPYPGQGGPPMGGQPSMSPGGGPNSTDEGN